MDEFSAAHHEAAHAVVAVCLGLPLQDSGLHLDTVDGGIIFNLHRVPGDQSNTPADIEQREQSIVMIKAGYSANLKLLPTTPVALAADDRKEEILLLDEMFERHGKQWTDRDRRLTAEADRLVDIHWDAIRALAQAVLAMPVIPRTRDSFLRWSSPYPNEKWISGYGIASILEKFGLTAIVRRECEGNYHPPRTNPESKLPC